MTEREKIEAGLRRGITGIVFFVGVVVGIGFSGMATIWNVGAQAHLRWLAAVAVALLFVWAVAVVVLIEEHKPKRGDG